VLNGVSGFCYVKSCGESTDWYSRDLIPAIFAITAAPLIVNTL